jgi:tetratricopeptide (TPR) repeat protein
VKRLLLALVGAPLLVAALLAAIELGFVLAGSDPRRHYFLPAIAAEGPRSYVACGTPPIENTRFRVQRFPERPAAGVRRVVCVGDSTCFGHPFEPPVPYPCWIEMRLGELLPNASIEVLNLGSNGFSSEDVLDLLEETDLAGADVLVVYVGHNEFLDRNLLPIVNPFAHALRRALSRSRLGTVALECVRRPVDARELVNRVKSERIRDAAFLTDAELRRGADRYREHLERIVALATTRGARTLLVHPVADLVDTPTESSTFAATTPDAERTRFRKVLAEAMTARRGFQAELDRGGALEADRIAESLRRVDELERIDAGIALCHYERGWLLLRAGRTEEARRELQRALDEDGAPIRLTRALHEVIDEVALTHGAIVVDPRSDLDAAAAPGLPGQNGWFIDYVHPVLRGHQLLADTILKTMASSGVLARASEWKFQGEPSYEEYLLRAGYRPGTYVEARARAALPLLLKSHFKDRDPAAAESARHEFLRLIDLDPKCATAWLGLGVVEAIEKRTDDALAAFGRAADLAPAAVEQIATPYRTNPVVHALFDDAGLTFRDGRIVQSK